MSDVTGRDHWLTLKALAIAIRAIEAAPQQRQPSSDRDDMVRLFKALAGSEAEVEDHVRSASYVVEGIVTMPDNLRRD